MQRRPEVPAEGEQPRGHRAAGGADAADDQGGALMASNLEQQFLFQIRSVGLPMPVTEYRFAPPRRFRFDLAWPEQGKLACEIDGAVWVNGRHSRGSGIQRDCEKFSLAAIHGWRVMRVTGDMVKSGKALKLLELAIGAKR